MIKRILICLAMISAIGSAQAAELCYRPSEIEAEQGLRIQSELMVIALSCIKVPDAGPALYAQYQAFTEKHQSLLREYERVMMSYYKGRGKNANEQLYNLKTKLANDISKRAVSMSISQFCQRFGPRIPQAMAMDEAKLRRWAQHVWPESPTTVAACKK